jgi:hypothetical protein
MINSIDDLVDLYAKDYAAFAVDCIKVQDEDGEVVPFRFNRMQDYLWKLENGLEPDYFGNYRKAEEPFWAVVLKIRRAGASLYFTNRLMWKNVWKANRKGHLRAHDDETTDFLFGMLKYSFKNLPPEVKPFVKLDNRDILYLANPDSDAEIKGIDSMITVATAGSPHKSAGFGTHDLHLAEFGRYDEITDTKKMMTTVKQTIPYRAHTSIVIESTAHGEGTFKRYWEEDQSLFLKAFISYVAMDKYRKETEHFELSGVDESEFGNEENEAVLIEKEILRWFPEWADGNHKAEVEHEVYCRLAWRRFEIINYCEGDKKIFDQEYPITPDRAFMLSGDSVFSTEKLYFLAKELKADPPPVTRFKFDTSYEIEPFANIGHDADLLWDMVFKKSGYGPLHIYEEPQDGAHYAMGLDPAEGLTDGDESALVLIRIPEWTEVAVWNKPLDPDLFADLAYILGLRYNRALIGVEMNAGGHGTEVLRRLLRHLRYPAARIYRDKKWDKVKVDHDKRYGLHMNRATKQALLDYMKSVIRDETLTFRSLDNVKEHKNFKKIKDDYCAIAEDGSKRSANLVMATAIAVHMARVFSSYVSATKEKPAKNSLAEWKAKGYMSANITGAISNNRKIEYN